MSRIHLRGVAVAMAALLAVLAFSIRQNLYCKTQLFPRGARWSLKTTRRSRRAACQLLPDFISSLSKPRPLRTLRLLPLYIYGVIAFAIPSIAFAYTFPGNNYSSPNPNVVYDFDKGKMVYTTSNGVGPFDSAQEACVAAMPAPYNTGSYIIAYSNPRAGVDPNYGYGCYYHVVYTLASTGQIIDDYPNWFGQNWYGYGFSCPDGYQALDIEKGPADFGHELGTATCGKPLQLYIVLDLKSEPKNLGGGSCPKVAVGDPVNPATGNKFEIVADYTGSGFSPLHWQRTYNSMARDNGFWTHSYSARVKPKLPKTLPPPNVLQSNKYYPLTSACSNGWYDIRASAPTQELRQASAVYENGQCALYNSSSIRIGSTTIYTDTPPQWVKIYSDTVDVVRSDGKVYTFTKVAGNWTSDSDVLGTLNEIIDANGFPTGWAYTTADNTVEAYDAAGNLLSITKRDGAQQTLTYSDTSTSTNIAPAPGLLIDVSDSFGRAINITYDANARIQTVSDPATGLFSYAYDSDGNISSVTYPDGKSRTYLYNEAANTSGADLPHALTGVLDENGDRYSTSQYDAQGRAIATERAGGAEHTSLVYNADGSTTVTDALGTARTYTFQKINDVSKNTGVTQPCSVCSGTAAQNIAYDVNGNVASRTDFNGVTTTYSYDLTRNLEISRTEASGTPQARTIITQWHPTFRLPTLITEPGKTTAYTYDNATGLLLTKTITDTARATSRTWNYTYTTQGLVETIDGPRTDVNDVTTFAYDAQGNVTTITNALGQITQISSYDANGRPLTVVDPNDITTTLTYSPRGWLASRSVGGETTSYDYDGVGQLTKVTLPDYSYISYSYDAAHRLTGIADSLGNHITYTLDAMGNRTEEDVYDPSNTLTQTRSRMFNALNRLAQDIGAQNQTSDYSYDNNGNLTASGDPLSHVTANGYDALNRLTQVTDPNNGITRYDYDSQDHLTSVTDPRDLQTTYTYDVLDNLEQVVSPDTGTTTNTFDSTGNLATSVDARGAVTTYTYDALNRVIEISATLGAGTSTTSFQYDSGAYAIGKLSSISDADSTTTYSYDSLGRLSTKTQQIGALSLAESYSYDSAGRIYQITYPSGKVINYGYDLQGRINSLSVDGQTALSNIQYSPFGAATDWTWGNGSSYSRPLDGDGRVAAFTLNGILRTVTYDAASRITDLTDALNQHFDYDDLDRLTGYLALTATQTFSYDGVGNRTQVSDGANSDSYSYAATSNRLIGISGSHNKSYSYTANGNISSDGSHSYAYDPRNRMVSADSVNYTLNGLGQRIEKHDTAAPAYGPGDADGDDAYTVVDSKVMVDQILEIGTVPGNADCNGDNAVDVLDLVCLNNQIAAGAVPISSGRVLFAYDEQGQLIGEYNSGGSAIEETVYLGGQPVAVLKQSEVYYIHTDQLNTPRAISDSANTVVWRWDSDPFGTTAANDDPDLDGVKFTYNLRFPGQYYDRETGLNYNYYRDYDPRTGRYVESDPIGLIGGFNTYTYVLDNPTGRFDLLGLLGYMPSQGQGMSIRDFFSNLPGTDVNTVCWLTCRAEKTATCTSLGLAGMGIGGGIGAAIGDIPGAALGQRIGYYSATGFCAFSVKLNCTKRCKNPQNPSCH